jgi:hypothetical protein
MLVLVESHVPCFSSSNIGVEGHYWFTPTATIVPTLGGFRRYESGDKWRTEHFVCVAPLLPVTNSSSVPPLPPQPYPFDVSHLAHHPCAWSDLFYSCHNGHVGTLLGISR